MNARLYRIANQIQNESISERVHREAARQARLDSVGPVWDSFDSRLQKLALRKSGLGKEFVGFTWDALPTSAKQSLVSGYLGPYLTR